MADQVFILPDLGEGLTEAQVVRWKVQEGSQVQVNDPLCEVETAKAMVEVPSPWAGVVRRLHARPGEFVPVGSPLITIAASEETVDAPSGGVLVGYGPQTGPDAGMRRRGRVSPVSSTSLDEEVRAAPFVRQLARERGIDLAKLRGTGPGGRITRADVETAAVAAGAGTPAAAAGDERISVIGIRKAIARQMVRSVTTIPQFTEFAVFDATNLMTDRERRKAGGEALTPLPYFVRALVKAVRDFPLLNSSWDDERDEIVIKRSVHAGIAVNTPQGLLVPVIRDADRLDLTELAARAATLIAGARAGTLKPGELTGGTITVTNVGASGSVETGTPIINPPECCVVGFGAIRPRPLVVDGQVVARPSCWISISVDHRVVDGALAAEFLSALVRYLENLDG